MIRPLLTLFLIATAAMAQSAPAGVGPSRDPALWARYTVKGEEFSVTLPTLPAMSTVKTFQSRLQKHRRERQLSTSLAGVTFVIDVFENLKPRQSLEEFIAEQNENSEYDLTTERNLTMNGFAGKEYSVKNKTSPAIVQLFATDGRLVKFTAVGATVEDSGVKQFFSSIVLGKKTDGANVSEGAGIPLDLDARTYLSKEVDVKVRLLQKPEPSYTEKARAKQIEGTVVLKALFTATGQIGNIRVVSGLPHGLTEKAVEVARKIKFTPAMKDGKYVSMWIQLEYNFYLY